MSIIKINFKLLFVACFSLSYLQIFGQERVHELYKTADYDVHHDRKVRLNWAESITTFRTWQAHKNKDGSYTWKDYTKGSGGNNGTYHEVLAKKYMSSEITVSKNRISVYWEERWIRPSDFYTDAETNDPMKQGSMKPPKDPFDGHKKGSSTSQDLITVGDKTFKIKVQHYCTHQRIPLYRGSDMGMGFGVGVTTNSRGRKTVTSDYFPDHLFRHQIRLSFSIDEMAKSANMTKADLIVYLIENNDKLADLNIKSYLERSGFIYCAYRAFSLEKFKELHARQLEEKRLERAKQDSIRQAEEEQIRREVDEAIKKADNEYWNHMGIEKKTSADKAAAEGVNLVNLGLSVRWADRNIGAAQPEDEGYQFRWGEVNPCSYSAKYKPVKKPKKGAVLDAMSDPATVKWGVGFHVPTPEQWKELHDKCTFMVDEEKKIVVVTGPNGNSIVLPCEDKLCNYVNNWANAMSTEEKEAYKSCLVLRKKEKWEVGKYVWETKTEYHNPVRAVME